MSKINEDLTELLKGKVIKKMSVTAFPDIVIEFEDGIVFHCVCEWKGSKITTGDEQGCVLYIDKKMIGKFTGRYDDITGLWTEIKEE